MSTTTSTKPIDPLDYLEIDTLLSDEERLIRDTVRSWVGEHILPNVGGVVRGRAPADVGAGAGARQARPARHAPRGLRHRGRKRRRVRPRVLGAGGRRLRHPQPRVGAGLAVDVRDLALGLGGAEAALAAADGHRRAARLLRAHRARCRIRPRRHAHARAPRRRRLDPERRQDVDHERLRRRRRRRVGADRRRHPRVPGREGHEGLLGTRHQAQDLAARLDHVGAGARRRAGAGRRDPARGEGPARAAVVPERGALRHRLGRRRRRSRLLRVGARVLEDADRLLEADRRRRSCSS